MSRMEDSGAAQPAEGGTAENIRNKAKEVGEQLRDMGQQAREKAQAQYERLREHASEYYESGRRHAQEWEQSLESYVREQPIKSLLIAAGIGVVLGALWKRS